MSNNTLIAVALLLLACVLAVRLLEDVPARSTAETAAGAVPFEAAKKSKYFAAGGPIFAPAAGPCADLDIGEGRVINMSWRQSPTNVPADYLIKRVSRERYDVYLNLRFEAADDYDGPVAHWGADGHYRDHAQRCVAQFNNKLRDQSGTRINLKIVPLDDRDLQAVVPVAPLIKVHRKNIRDHSRGWSSNIACPVVIHELMHVLGLVDEYEPVPAWRHQETHTCRITGPASSIMRSSWAATRHASVLWPGHIKALIYPGCKEINAVYYGCAKGAYKGAKRDDGCPRWSAREKFACFQQCAEGDCEWLE